MRKNINRIRVPIIFSILFFFIAFFSLSLLAFMPMVESGYQEIVGYTVAILFWSCLPFGFVFCFQTKLSVRRILLSLKKRSNIKQQKYPGIITFSRDIRHMMLYVVIGIGMILMITDMIDTWVPSYIMFPVISITMFTFAMHCIVDGSNYKIYKQMKEGINND